MKGTANRRNAILSAAAIFFALVIMSLTGCASLKKNKELRMKAQINYNTGVEYLNIGEYSVAMDNFLKAQQYAPDDPMIHNGKGLAFLGQGRPHEARIEFEKALELNDDIPEIYTNLGNALMAQGLYDKAIEKFQEALNDPGYRYPASALYAKAQCLISLGRDEDAREALQEAIRHEPSYDRPYYSLGMLARKDDKLREAIRYFDSAVKSNPYAWESWYQSALTYLDMNDEEEAIRRLRRIRNNAPENTIFYKKAGELLQSLETPVLNR